MSRPKSSYLCHMESTERKGNGWTIGAIQFSQLGPTSCLHTSVQSISERIYLI